MIYVYIILVFLYGTLFGSFFNVVGYRLPKNLSIVKPSSFCPKCNHQLKWYELFPIISFLIQRGRCRNCQSEISLFYPLMEALTGILFVVSYLTFGFTIEFIIACLVASFFVIVIVSDMNYLIIPDETTIFFSLIVIVLTFIIEGLEAGLMSLVVGISLFIIMYIIMLLGNKVFNKESMGGGDIKLMFFVGTVTYYAFFNGVFVIFLSSFLALPFSIFMYLRNNNKVIPYGPFILLSLFIIYISQIDIIKLILK